MTTTTSRPDSMLSRNYNLNPVIDVRRRWQWCMRSSFVKNMILRLLLATFVLATAVSGQAPPTAKADLSRWLTPENCASSDPDALYIKHLKVDGLRWDSEQARDNFHQIYAEVLAKKSDQQFPDAAKFRKPLLAAFEQTFEFIRTANGHTSTAHQMSRLPAELEWKINRGFESKFDNGVSGEYTFDNIRDLARIYKESQGFADGRDLSHIQADVLEPALEQLKTAEQSMSKKATIYFRAKLVSIIAQYLGRGPQ